MKEGEIHPPVRAGQPLPGPGGEVLRPVHHAVQGCAGPKGIKLSLSIRPKFRYGPL